MAFINYRKETSERSDATNWAKKILIEKTGLFFDAIEGCNENNNNVVTHLFERARVDFVPGESLETDVLSEIILLETPEVLQRKINFANTFNCPLHMYYIATKRKLYGCILFLILSHVSSLFHTIHIMPSLIGSLQLRGGDRQNHIVNVKIYLILIKLLDVQDVLGLQI